VIGCGQIKPHGEGIRELASIVVAPEFRGNGVAGRIISQLLSSSPMPIYLMCRSTLGTFYLRFGFSPVPVDEMPVYFRRIARLTGLFSRLNKEAGTLLILKHE
jgi:amino-acid N-acetyltransferase